MEKSKLLEATELCFYSKQAEKENIQLTTGPKKPTPDVQNKTEL